MELNLRRIPFFTELPDDVLDAIRRRLRVERHPRSAILFREGDLGDTLYLVQSGQLKVYSDATGEERIFAYIGPGGFVGELALLLEQPRSATVVVMIDAEVALLTKGDLEDLLRDYPAIAIHLGRELGRRLVATSHQPYRREEINLIAVEGPALALAASLMTQAGGRIGLFNLASPIAPERGRGVAIIDPPADMTVDSLAQILGELVGFYERLVVALPYGGGKFHEKIVELADGVAVIGSGKTPAWAQGARRYWSLINEQHEIDRLARLIGRRTVGLVMSSGGAKGIAHVGVLKALKGADVPIDLVAGSSAGSLFGAMFCAGKSIDEIIAFAKELKKIIQLRGGLWDVAIPPISGLIHGRKTAHFLDKALGGKTFDDLRIPLYIVAADITVGEQVVFNWGPVSDAVRASIGIPGIFAPWPWNGRYLVDGGVVNPVPISVLREHGADRVIVSSVVRTPEERGQVPPDAKRPNFIELMTSMMGAMEGEILKIRLSEVDVFIHPQVHTYSALDYEKAEELIEIGEMAAREKLPAIQEMLRAQPHY
ncbi:MAG TPA: patatin-like phospholipase family protein [Anaerolineae bacterium]|nr:patatin-like phospholipase family protein [Anaerolineae bacterium]